MLSITAYSWPSMFHLSSKYWACVVPFHAKVTELEVLETSLGGSNAIGACKI
jgi:hypothetical protein